MFLKMFSVKKIYNECKINVKRKVKIRDKPCTVQCGKKLYLNYSVLIHLLEFMRYILIVL